MTQTAINGELKRINDKIKYLESSVEDATQTGSLVMLEMTDRARKEILREFSIIQEERDNAVAALKDNLKDHLAPYKNEDIQKIREEKMQLVTAAEFKAVHRQMLEQTSKLEKKLSTAVEALKEISKEKIPFRNGCFYGEETSEGALKAKQALEEIGGEDE